MSCAIILVKGLTYMKKMIAPIIVTVIFVLYFFAYAFGIIYFVPNVLVKVLLGVIPALFGAVMIYVCLQRFKEIRSGEEDDLSKY